MIGVPFGVSYFPMSWTSHHNDVSNEDDNEQGMFPIPGKEAFGIRLFLFSTLIGQFIYTFYSGFHNPIGLQMVENIGFTRALSQIAISHQGYGIDTLATLMVMFGLASILVGIVFYLLGKFQLGKIVYFFPTHVLIGLIGGIGILLCKTGLEVTLGSGIVLQALVDHRELWVVIVGLEILLRFLERITTNSKGKPMFALLSPIYFCMITPCFYLVLWIIKIPISVANDAGYFFPPLINEDDQNESVMSNYGTPWDVWKVRISILCLILLLLNGRFSHTKRLHSPLLRSLIFQRYLGKQF
jgi:SulP family sulfate permease